MSFKHFRKLVGILYILLSRFWVQYVLCQGDKIAYLRRQGARIGAGCDFFNSPVDFGSEPWLIQIGNDVTVGSGVRLVTHDGASRLFRKQLANASRFGNSFGTIVIEDNSFIGIDSIILPGVKIGPNSIVGAGSVVTRDVPANTVVAGSPARPILTYDEYVQKYQQNMIPLQAETREELRDELTLKLWGEKR